jgi:hypothetical protein
MLRPGWSKVALVLSFFNLFFFLSGSEFIWVRPFIVTVKGSEKNDPGLRNGILGKSLTPFLLFLLQFYFKV